MAGTKGSAAQGPHVWLQGEGTYAKNVGASKKVAKYFLEPPSRTTLSEIRTFIGKILPSIELCVCKKHIYIYIK